MKFYIRRAIAGLLAIPFVAGAWVFLYLLLIVIGGEPQQSIDETFHNGILVAITLAVSFTFYPQIIKFATILEKEDK